MGKHTKRLEDVRQQFMAGEVEADVVEAMDEETILAESTASQDALTEEIEAALALSTQNEGEEHTMYTSPSLADLVKQAQERQELDITMPKKLKKTIRNHSRDTLLSLLVMSMAQQVDSSNEEVVQRMSMVENLVQEGGIDPDEAMVLIADLFVTDGIKFLETASKFNSNSIGRVVAWIITGDVLITNRMKKVFKELSGFATMLAEYNTQVLSTYSDERDLKALRDKLATHLGKSLEVEELTKVFMEFAAEKEREALAEYQTIDEPTVVEVLPPQSGPFAAPKEKSQPAAATAEPIEVNPVNFTMVEPATLPTVATPTATIVAPVAEEPVQKPKAPTFVAKMCDFELKYA